MGDVTGRGFERVLMLAREVRRKLGPLWWYSLLMFSASRVTDLLNLYFGVFFLPRVLSVGELGAVDPVTRLTAFGGIPLAVVSIVGAKYLSVYHARGEDGKIKRFMRDMSWLALASAALFVAVLVVAFDSIETRLHLESPHLLLGLSGVAVLACWQPLIRTMLQGMQRFYTSMAIGPLDAASRLALSCLLIPLFHLSGYLFALFATGVITAVAGFWSIKACVGKSVKSVSYYSDWRGIVAFAWPVAVWTLGANLQGFIEPLVVRHFLSIQDSAGYYMVCRFGAIPGYLVGAVSFVLFPLLSHKHERGEDTGGYLKQALLVASLVCMAGTVLMGLTSEWIFGLRPQWLPFGAYAPFVWLIGAMVTMDAVNSIYIMHEVACRRFAFLWAIVPVILVECAVLYGAFGWGALQNVLPGSVWEWGSRSLPRTLAFALWIMVGARVATTIGFALCWRAGARRKAGD